MTLAIGPANYSGQAYAWARAVEDNLGIEAYSFGKTSVFDFDVDISDPHVYRPLIKGKDHPTHLIIDGFTPFLGGNLAKDVNGLIMQGRNIALMAHGSEFRAPWRHIRRVQHSHFKSAPQQYMKTFTRYTKMTHSLVRHTGLPLFVSTPDLLLEGMAGKWVPLVVKGWECNKPLSKSKPKVLHHPSRKSPPIKGTTFIMPVLESLAEQGKIELVPSTMGKHSDVKPLVQSCDILVEQILIGSYGVAAAEGMQAGRLVIGYLADDVRAIVDPPIVDARPDRFKAVMNEVVDNWDHYRQVAAEGPEYAALYHDGRAAARVLHDWLLPDSVAWDYEARSL